MIPGSATPLLLAQSGDDGYKIDRSLRFNSADSAYLNRTPSSAGNRKTWTWSAWVKLSSTSTGRSRLFGACGANTGSPYNFATDIGLNGNKIVFTNSANDIYTTDAVFRDFSAWYHIVVTLDTTDATTANRVKIYVNGVLQDKTHPGHGGAGEPSQNSEYAINNTDPHNLGSTPNTSGTATSFFDGYLADVYVIDGQALDPTAFGEFDDNNVWQAKEVSITSPNDGTTWSSGWDGNAVNPTYSFDNTTNFTSPPNGTTTWTAPSSISVNSTLRLYLQPGIANYNTLVVNGTSYSQAQINAVLGTNEGYFTISGATSLSSITLTGDSGNNVVKLRYVEVDGEVLIDGYNNSTGYGTNGFHLDFSDNSTAAALGTDTSGNGNDWTPNNFAVGGAAYSNNVTGYLNSLFDTATYPVTNLFDGSTSTIVFSSSVSGSGIKFVPPTTITGSIELYLRNGDTDNSTFSYSLDNGSSFTNLTTTGGDGSYVSIGSQTIDTTNGIIVRHVTTAGTNNVNWRAIRVDGTVLTDGAAGDSLVDSPTNGTQTDTGAGGEVVGNYCTWNPLNSEWTLADGNLQATCGTGSGSAAGTIAVSSGKYYWEVTASSTGGTAHALGVAETTYDVYAAPSTSTPVFVYFASAVKVKSGSSTSYGASWDDGDVIGVALDCDNGTLTFYKNGASQGQAFTGMTSGPYMPIVSNDTSSASWTATANFGQRPFAYTPPTGYKSLCTTNLPDPTIADGSTAFDTKIYTGNGSSQTISGFSFSPDFAWFKNRATNKDPRITDTIRGTGVELYSTSTSGDYSQPQGVTAFNSDGVSVGSDGGYNGSGQGMVLWAWDAGSSNTSISAGSLNSTAYDQSQTWSSQITGTSYSGYPKTRVFNNNNTENALPADNNELVFTPSPSFSNASTVKIWYYYPSTHANAFKINGTAVGNDVAQTSTILTHTFNVSGFTSLSWSRNKYGSEDTGIARIDVDGVQLVDSSVTVPNVPSIASTVRANPSAGFSIVSYTGTGSAATIGHGLNAKPVLNIFKRTGASTDWLVYTDTIDGSWDYLVLNSTAAKANTSVFSANSSTFDFSGASNGANASGGSTIAYCFAPVEGYSAFGSYTGNGSSDGPFVFTGFKVAFLLTKRTDTSENWEIRDSTRNPYNRTNLTLFPHSSGAEDTGSVDFDFLSNGFKVRNTNGSTNANGGTYIYAAFAESPFKTARAR